MINTLSHDNKHKHVIIKDRKFKVHNAFSKHHITPSKRDSTLEEH